MVSESKTRLTKTKVNSYLIYLPKDVAEDSQFPFSLKNQSTIYLKISIAKEKDGLLIEKWTEER